MGICYYYGAILAGKNSCTRFPNSIRNGGNKRYDWAVPNYVWNKLQPLGQQRIFSQRGLLHAFSIPYFTVAFTRISRKTQGMHFHVIKLLQACHSRLTHAFILSSSKWTEYRKRTTQTRQVNHCSANPFCKLCLWRFWRYHQPPDETAWITCSWFLIKPGL